MTTNNNNKYGHLLDKYMDDAHIDYKTKQEREEDAENKYGHLVDYMKPDYSTLEVMVKLEDSNRERRRKEAEEEERANQRRQERIEREKREQQERIDRNSAFVESFLAKKEEERKVAQYIIGENEAFNALTSAVRKSNISVKTTRFSPYSVVGRQNTFFNAINDLMSQDVHPETFERIIAANNIEKFNEIAKLMANNAGKDFKIYIYRIEYSFEMVVIDDEIVFIHFRKYIDMTGDRPSNQPISLITATLKIEKRIIANEFSTIFDSIKNNSKDIVCVIDCSKITTENLGQEIDKYRTQFNNAVKEYQDAINKKI